MHLLLGLRAGPEATKQANRNPPSTEAFNYANRILNVFSRNTALKLRGEGFEVAPLEARSRRSAAATFSWRNCGEERRAKIDLGVFRLREDWRWSWCVSALWEWRSRLPPRCGCSVAVDRRPTEERCSTAVWAAAALRARRMR